MSLFSMYHRSSTYTLLLSHSWDNSDDYVRLVNLLDADSSFRWENLSVPKCNPLPVRDSSLSLSFRAWVKQLDERVRSSDCVLVPAAMYVAHSGWIQSEIEAAKEFGKPIVAIRPCGQQRFPVALDGIAPVSWTTDAIISEVRRVCPFPQRGSVGIDLRPGVPKLFGKAHHRRTVGINLFNPKR